jgi:hypothetical protein
MPRRREDEDIGTLLTNFIRRDYHGLWDSLFFFFVDINKSLHSYNNNFVSLMINLLSISINLHYFQIKRLTLDSELFSQLLFFSNSIFKLLFCLFSQFIYIFDYISSYRIKIFNLIRINCYDKKKNIEMLNSIRSNTLNCSSSFGLLAIFLLLASPIGHVKAFWWSLGLRSSLLSPPRLDRPEENSIEYCSSFEGLTPGQMKLCELYSDHISALAKGAKIGMLECQHQFKSNQWNCSSVSNQTVFGTSITNIGNNILFISIKILFLFLFTIFFKQFSKQRGGFCTRNYRCWCTPSGSPFVSKRRLEHVWL